MSVTLSKQVQGIPNLTSHNLLTLRVTPCPVDVATASPPSLRSSAPVPSFPLPHSLPTLNTKECSFKNTKQLSKRLKSFNGFPRHLEYNLDSLPQPTRLGGRPSQRSFHATCTQIHSLTSCHTGLWGPKMSQGLHVSEPSCLLFPLPITYFPDLQSWLLFILESWLKCHLYRPSFTTLNCHHVLLSSHYSL